MIFARPCREWSDASLPFPSFQIHNWPYSLNWGRIRILGLWSGHRSFTICSGWRSHSRVNHSRIIREGGKWVEWIFHEQDQGIRFLNQGSSWSSARGCLDKPGNRQARFVLNYPYATSTFYSGISRKKFLVLVSAEKAYGYTWDLKCSGGVFE